MHLNEVVPVDELINHIQPSAGRYLCYFLARILLVESSKLWIKTFYLGWIVDLLFVDCGFIQINLQMRNMLTNKRSKVLLLCTNPR